MLRKLIDLQKRTRGAWQAVGFATLVSFNTANIGRVITFTAEAKYMPSRKQPLMTVKASRDVVVVSPITGKKPVYLTKGWIKTDGSGQVIFNDTLAKGILVRAFVRADGRIQLMDGIQLADGRVWVNGRAYERADGPGG